MGQIPNVQVHLEEKLFGSNPPTKPEADVDAKNIKFPNVVLVKILVIQIILGGSS